MLDVKQHLSKAKLRLLEFVCMNETLGSNEIEEKQEKKEHRAQATGVKEMTHCSLYTVRGSISSSPQETFLTKSEAKQLLH